MMTEQTKMAILALVEVDKQATEPEREAVRVALDGGRSAGRLLSYREVSKRLGCHRNTIRNLVKMGRLSAVTGSGDRKYKITEESLIQYAGVAV